MCGDLGAGSGVPEARRRRTKEVLRKMVGTGGKDQEQWGVNIPNVTKKVTPTPVSGVRTGMEEGHQEEMIMMEDMEEEMKGEMKEEMTGEMIEEKTGEMTEEETDRKDRTETGKKETEKDMTTEETEEEVALTSTEEDPTPRVREEVTQEDLEVTQEETESHPDLETNLGMRSTPVRDS